MTPEELAHAVGRLESSLEGLHDKLDQMVLPASKDHAVRLGALEKALYTTQGILLLGSAGLVFAKDIFVEWVKRKIAANH